MTTFQEIPAPRDRGRHAGQQRLPRVFIAVGCSSGQRSSASPGRQYGPVVRAQASDLALPSANPSLITCLGGVMNSPGLGVLVCGMLAATAPIPSGSEEALYQRLLLLVCNSRPHFLAEGTESQGRRSAQAAGLRPRPLVS